VPFLPPPPPPLPPSGQLADPFTIVGHRVRHRRGGEGGDTYYKSMEQPWRMIIFTTLLHSCVTGRAKRKRRASKIKVEILKNSMLKINTEPSEAYFFLQIITILNVLTM
jgi:hypothetical protein